jgi:hypothetical protein
MLTCPIDLGTIGSITAIIFFFVSNSIAIMATVGFMLDRTLWTMLIML